MWARIVESMLGVWLLMSPFIFRHTSDATHLWINDLAMGCTLIVLSLASYWSKTRGAHWLLLVAAVWLIGFGRLNGTPPLQPALQNNLIVGLLLGMVAIVPNEASLPPVRWRQQENSTTS
ncbi:SPW repeat protein [Aeoliella sp. ICT_H6.2]|uniref:SPW repeat protein n=1 Tax=Aeoliella straminimaris TaxID=2954799 RepID=A0A9X2FED9_9BACT|nr:SPW repeat protein [Aeoliella straminimaris]MCO6047490.1 SPW repeat protein [Aeoliella straminimaris]